MNLILFILIFFYLSNWFQIVTFLSLLIGPKMKTHTVDDTWIKSVTKKKSGLTLLDITIFEDKKPYGMMAGLPFWPKMILSEVLYESFNRDELEWVILHEAGHCVFWHNLQAFLLEMLMVSLGVYAIHLFSLSLMLSLLLAIFLSIVSIQIIRWTIEYSADQYSINRVDNPKGVITAQDKFRNAYGEKGVMRYLFHWNIPLQKRIEMANQRIKALIYENSI